MIPKVGRWEGTVLVIIVTLNTLGNSVVILKDWFEKGVTAVTRRYQHTTQ